MDADSMTFRDMIETALNAHKSEKQKDRIIADMGFELTDCDEENRSWADYLYRKQETYLNPYDGIHGGIACVMGDTCMGTTICAATQRLPSTTDMSVSYLSPMTADVYRIHVEIKKTGKQLISSTCEICEYDTGKLCVCMMARFIFANKKLAGDAEAAKLLI